MEVQYDEAEYLLHQEFKMEILSQIEAGVPIAQIARYNELHPTFVARWKQEYLENPENMF